MDGSAFLQPDALAEPSGTLGLGRRAFGNRDIDRHGGRNAKVLSRAVSDAGKEEIERRDNIVATVSKVSDLRS